MCVCVFPKYWHSVNIAEMNDQSLSNFDKPATISANSD